MIVISGLTWAEVRDYEVGIDRGVYYPLTGPGEAWSGLISVQEKPELTSTRAQYVDGIKVRQIGDRGVFSGTIEAYNYPDSLYSNIFGQRKATRFGMSYRTGGPKHYRIHLVYNVVVAPSPYLYEQIDVDAFRWPFTSMAVEAGSAARTAHLIVDTAAAYPGAVVNLEDILYGTEEEDPRLPTPAEVLDIFEENAVLQIIDNGDGTWTAIGPDSAIVMLDAETFEITWPSAVYIDADTYTIHSL